MRAMRFNDGATEYVRISKRKARQLFDTGGVIVLCPVNLRPGFPFAMHTQAQKSTQEFQTFVNQWTYYNCENSETGLYAAFYRQVSI